MKEDYNVVKKDVHTDLQRFKSFDWMYRECHPTIINSLSGLVWGYTKMLEMTSKTEQPTFQEHLFLDATRVYYLLHVRGTKWCQKHFTVTMIDVESHLQARLTWNTLDCNGETSTVNKWQQLKMIRSCWWLNWSFKTLQQPQEFLILLRKLTLYVGSGW